MLPCEENLLSIIENGLKYSKQRLLDLMFKVVLIVDWKVVVKDIKRIL